MRILRTDNVRSIRGWLDFETWTDQTTKPRKCAKKNLFDKKSFIFKVELLIFERLGLVCFLDHRDFDNPESDDLMNGENDRDEFRGPVGGRRRDTHTADKVLTHGHTLLFYRYRYIS